MLLMSYSNRLARLSWKGSGAVTLSVDLWSTDKTTTEPSFPPFFTSGLLNELTFVAMVALYIAVVHKTIDHESFGRLLVPYQVVEAHLPGRANSRDSESAKMDKVAPSDTPFRR
jgi:hypothetical protein